MRKNSLKSKIYKCVLILFEGETEEVFYKKFFQEISPNYRGCFCYLLKRMKGQDEINSKILGLLKYYNDILTKCKSLYVIIAYDREGNRDTAPLLNANKIFKQAKSAKLNKVKNIIEVIATQCIESWFFYDSNGIYDFIGTGKKSRNLNKYPNPESCNHTELTQFIRQVSRHKKDYQKGENAIKLIDKLDLKLIHSKVKELQDLTDFLDSLCK